MVKKKKKSIVEKINETSNKTLNKTSNETSNEIINIKEYVINKIKYYQSYSHIKYYLDLKEKFTNSQIIDILENKLINSSNYFEDFDIDKVLYEICNYFNFDISNIIIFLKKMYACQIDINFNYTFSKNNENYNFQNPLIYFDVGYGRCGDISRFCIDLFKVGFDYEGRLLQFKNHVSCEINIEGEWKLIEVDLNSNYNNNILEGIQIIKKETIDRCICMTAHNPIFYMINNGSYGKTNILSGYPSYFFNKFIQDQYHYNIIIEKDYESITNIKKNKYNKKNKLYLKYLYFWNHRHFYFLSNKKEVINTEIYAKTISDYNNSDNNNLLHQMLQFSEINELRKNEIKISWIKEDIIKKYKILVSDKSRGWNYIKIYNKNIENYINKITLEQNNFDKIYDNISSNIYNYETEDNNIIIDKQNFEKLYVSIIPVDYYGYSIDRLYYLPSEEIII